MSEERNGQRLARERLLHQYDDALARGDMATVAEILAQAEEDPELAEMLIALNAALADFDWSAAAPAARKWESGAAPAPRPARRLPGPDLPAWPRGWLSGALSVALVSLLLAGILFVVLQMGGASLPPVAAPPVTAVVGAAATDPSATETRTPPPTATPGGTTAPTSSPTVRAGAVPSPTPLPGAAEPLTLTPPPSINAFPGPRHYQGEMLTFVIPLQEMVAAGQGPVTVGISNVGTVEVTGRWEGNALLVPLDTGELGGDHFLTFEAQIEGVEVTERFYLELLPASQRPVQEEEAQWKTRSLPCCTLHYISHTAAARDIELIAEALQQAAADFTALTGEPLSDAVHIYLVDRVWGTGGFSGTDEVIISYTDRYYGPGHGLERLQVLARNGFAYATELNPPFFRFRLGLAAFLAGGHYQPTAIPRHAAAAGSTLFSSNQYEMSVLRQAALVAYLVERFGWEQFWAYVDADSQEQQPSRQETDAAMRQVFGVGLEKIEEEMAAWLNAIPVSTEERAQVRLTMRLHNLRRQYQQLIPQPQHLLGQATETYGRDEAVRSLIREPQAPANVAVELLLANARQAIAEGRIDEAENLLAALDQTLRSRALTHPLAAEYGAIARLLAEQGYETVGLTLDGAQATALVTRSVPALEELPLQKENGTWRISIP